MKIIDELGALVQNAWLKTNYSEDAFPEVAAQALAEINLPAKMTSWDTIHWLAAENQLPAQQDLDASFGNPPITLYTGHRFFIDIYFWVDGTTEIHQHGFAGAFQVLAGSSIHSRYSFKEEQAISQRFRLGQINFEAVELLQQGDIRRISPGGDHIHALFHLDRPSTTITVRTFGLPSHQPQYSYRKPNLAIDPFFKEPALTRKLQTAAMLIQLQDPAHDDLICELIASSDLHGSFLLLTVVYGLLHGNRMEKVFEVSTGSERFEKFLGAARKRHGGLTEFLKPVLEEADRVDDIVRRRQFITSPEHRFFLALILNVPTRVKVLELVAQRFPNQDPIDTVLDWVMELAATKVWGSSEPNVLGVAGFNDDYLFVLECLLREHPAEQIRVVIEGQYPPESARRLEENFERIAAELRSSLLFRTLLAA